jgi:hypothetical protein
MDEVSLITIGWERVGVESGHQTERSLKRVLGNDIEAGPVLVRLEKWNREEVWGLIDKTVTHERMRRVRVRKMKQELADIRAELEKAKDGHLVLTEIRQIIADMQATLRPLTHQLRHEELADEERKEIEKKSYKEFLLYRREMCGMLLEVKAWNIEVGPFLWDWFFNQPPPAVS